MSTESAKQRIFDHMRRNKRKHESDDESELSPKKKQRLHLPHIFSQDSIQRTSNSKSPSLCTQYTSNHILNDDDLYLSADDHEDDIDSEHRNGLNLSYSHHDSDDMNASYKTPIIRRRLLHPLNTKSSSSLSPFILRSETEREREIEASSYINIHSLSENALSVLFKYLTLNDMLSMSKTNRIFLQLSFKLMRSLTLYCKSISGVCSSSINNFLSRCSFYLSSLDLTAIGWIISDVTLNIMSIHCFQLKHLSLHGCLNITNCALIELLSSCKYLASLDISGCAQITSDIGGALSLSHHLNELNIAWCTEIDCNIVPYLVYLNENHSLRNVNIHCINKFITLYHAFKYVIETQLSIKLKHKLYIIGGLQQKTMNEENLKQQICYLESVGIHYTNPDSVNLRSISEYDFKYKLHLFMKSECVVHGYRVYTADNTDKIYVVINTNYGVFGTKLLPGNDFIGDRDEYMSLLIKSGRNPIQYLQSECNINNWKWQDEFQSKRSLSLLAMHRNANWIRITAIKYCPQINAKINQKYIE